MFAYNIEPLGSAQVIPSALKLMVFVGDVSSLVQFSICTSTNDS